MEEMSNFHLSICGHAKHGKSTLAGRLVYEMGGVTDVELSAYEKEATARGKDFNKYSLIFLKNRSSTFERDSGLPDDPSRTDFPSRGTMTIDATRLTLIDTPGVSRFLNNIVYGLYLADAAIVVVEASERIRDGTHAVCRILKAFDIPILSFCITKMDVVNYSHTLYDDLSELIRTDLVAKYDLGKNIPIIPVSAVEGIGVASTKSQSEKMPWYDGISLLDAINRAEKQVENSANKYVRLAVEGTREILSPPGIGTVLVGSLEYGTLSTGQTILAEPVSSLLNEKITARIRSIHLAKAVNEKTSQAKQSVSAKAIVGINVPSWMRATAKSYFRHGGVLGSPENPPRVAKSILATLVFFESNKVYSGKEYTLFPHVSGSTIRLKNILSQDQLIYDPTQHGIDGAGEFITAHLEFKTNCCIETLSDFPRLSKFVVREMNQIVACGTCLQILE